jgi:hypothetical protein
MIHRITLIIVACLLITSCKQNTQATKENTTQDSKEQKEETHTVSADIKNMKIDHFNLWTKQPEVFKKKLVEAGFTVVPDSLIPPHQGQGTRGKFMNFLNMYFELIYVINEEEFLSNQKANPLLDFETRGNHQENGASPFSVALKMKNYDVSKIPFETVRYHQSWMGSDSVSIQSAKSSKTNFTEPSVFVVYPEISADEFESLEEVDTKIPEEYAMWRQFFKHKNGAKKVTDIKIHIVRKHEVSDVMKTLNGLEVLDVIDDTSHCIEVDFDNRAQNITLDFRPDFPVIFRL